MNQKTITKINNLNKDFYNKYEQEFSITRQYPWNGWSRVLKHINIVFKNKDTIKVLDIGCGNGRFNKYLNENTEKKVEYLGVDNNDYLLSKVATYNNESRTKRIDIVNDLNTLNQTFDLIVAFGITHHIPGKSNREKWFSKIRDLLETNGLFVVTFWDTLQNQRFQHIKLEYLKSLGIKSEELEPGDLFLGWQKMRDTPRYVHNYSLIELKHLEKTYNSNGLQTLDKYYSDGKTNKLNTYLIFNRTI